MTNNSKMLKKLKKYSKNVKSLTKRRIRHKKSMRNKIQHGGDVRTLSFIFNGNIYTLTKDRVWNLGMSGAGKYKLESISNEQIISKMKLKEMELKGMELKEIDLKEMELKGMELKEIIPKMDLNEFITSLLSKEKIEIMRALYTVLDIKSKTTDGSFHFKSLHDVLNELQLIPNLKDDVYNRVTIHHVRGLLSSTVVMEYITKLNDDNMLKKNYTKFKKIFDDMMTDTYSNIFRKIYLNIPLYKINRDLPSLIETNKGVLGSGAFGTVYKVLFDGKECALKVIYINLYIKNASDVEKTMNGEVAAYNTISQLTCDKDNKLFCKFINTYAKSSGSSITVYVLMEYCGSSLNEHMKTGPNFGVEQIKPNIYKWLLNTAKGLQCMHGEKYAHLDIKPANIVIDTQTQESKLIDFGLIFNFSKYTSARKLPFAGTLDYMSPEMIKRSTGSSAQGCDVYSLGITFIECAFAFHYYDTYNECKNNKESLSYLMYDIFRYVPPVESQPELKSLILSSVIQNNDGDWNIIDENHPIDKTIVYTKNTGTESINYTLGDLYRDILDIHKKYPIFRKMIIEDPNGRCSIDEVISVCENIIQEFNTLKQIS